VPLDGLTGDAEVTTIAVGAKVTDGIPAVGSTDAPGDDEVTDGSDAEDPKVSTTRTC
jgi:hypothetical protein